MFEFNRTVEAIEESYPDTPPPRSNNDNGWMWAFILMIAFSLAVYAIQGCTGTKLNQTQNGK